MLAQRRRWWPNIISQLGQCIWVVAWDEIVTHTEWGLLLGHRQTRWINIEATLVSSPVIYVDAGVEELCVRSVLEWG